MYIDSLTIAAIVVFVFAMGLFVKTCFIDNCILSADRRTGTRGEVQTGGEE
jgi:hypothetical protein